MKGKIIATSTVLLGLTVFVFMAFTTRHSEAMRKEQAIRIENFKFQGTVCCTATCSKGRCTTSKSPCTCGCTASGFPRCSSKPVPTITEGDFEVTANEIELSRQVVLLEYLQGSENVHAEEAYGKALILYNLFAENQGLITSTEDLQLYYANLIDLEDILLNYFSAGELSEIQHL